MAKVIGDNHVRKLWVLKAKGSASAFGGNEGYPDDPEFHYVYDNTVKNYDRIAENDFVVVVDKTKILGFGRIDSITVSESVPKTRYRCPVCNTQEHYTRKGLEPKYKCRKKHFFDEAVEEHIFVQQFTAHYGENFQKAPKQTSVKLLTNYYIKRNFYYSIQAANPIFLDQFQLNPDLFYNGPSRSDLLLKWSSPYEPTGNDTRKHRTVKRYDRHGQPDFRMELIRIYGSSCMLTGTRITQAIEASHICPYRGKNDNHPANGLLLRKDLHALFDNDLIGFHPENLSVHLHSSLMGSHYEELASKTLKFETEGFFPSKEALHVRWDNFIKNQ